MIIKDTTKELIDKNNIVPSHYTKFAITPDVYAYKNKLGFHEGNVVKYITRHRDKNGKEDLLKAIKYIELLIEYEYSNTEGQ